MRKRQSATAGTVRSDRLSQAARLLGVNRLQEQAGNRAVTRLLAARPADRAVQRYAVGVGADASATEFLEWMNAANPHRPNWALTAVAFGYDTGAVVPTRQQEGRWRVRLRGSSVRLTPPVSVDMPDWAPSDAAMAAAWRRTHATLRAHEARHERIAATWRATLAARLAGFSPMVTADDADGAIAVGLSELDPLWQSWLADHQAVQSAIDPFTAPFTPPAGR